MPERPVDAQWSHRAFEVLLDATPEAILVVDQTGHIMAANRVTEQLFGRPRTEMIGHPAVMLVPEHNAETVLKHFEAFLSDPQRCDLGQEANIVGRHVDGVEFPVELSMTPLMHDGSTFATLAVRNVSRKRREEGLFQGLLEAAPDAMVIVDTEGEIVLVNAQVEKLFGYDRSELIGQPVEILVPERFSGMHVAFRHGYLSEPVARPMGLAGDLFARRRDDSEFPVEVSLAPMETDGGRLVSAAIRDISERRRMLDEAGRVKDEFFATVSHELRTPLTSMIGYGELMSDMEELSPQGRRFLSVIMRSAERELRLVDDLLTVVAIEESGLSIRPQDIDLEVVVRNAVEAARPPAEEAELTLSLETPGTFVQMAGDADRLGQALDNMLSNAIKFTPAGGRIKVSLRATSGMAEIDVEDSGSGIGEADPEKLFERLYRAADAYQKQIPGAGLGLPIAKAIIEAHGGTISVHSCEAGGTIFRVRLPAQSE